MPPKRASRARAAPAPAEAPAPPAAPAPAPAPPTPDERAEEEAPAPPAVIMHRPHVLAAAAAAAEEVTEEADDGPGPPGIDNGHALAELGSTADDAAAPARFAVMRGFDGFVWPRSTASACFWCCHPFEGQPFGLPMRYAGGVFFVWGCFCSLECAMALNRHERRGFPAAESANLLQLMAQVVGRKAPLRPAPDRSLLPLFGGSVPIDEFRGEGARDLNVHLPPMMAVVPSVEEVSTSSGAFARQDHRIPLDLTRIKNATEKARSGTRRSAKNTLEAAMPNLKVSA